MCCSLLSVRSCQCRATMPKSIIAVQLTAIASTMTDVREKFMTEALDLVIRVGDTFGEVCGIDLTNDPLVTFFFPIFAK